MHGTKWSFEASGVYSWYSSIAEKQMSSMRNLNAKERKITTKAKAKYICQSRFIPYKPPSYVNVFHTINQSHWMLCVRKNHLWIRIPY